MTDLVRQEITTGAKTVVVKVGTRVLSCPDGTLDQQRIARLADELNALADTGRQVVLVSSGAVGAGMSQLGLQERPTDLAKLQAVAAIGQTNLIEAYDRTFRKHGRHAAQILLTAEDLDERTRYLNVRNTIISLLAFNAIPIINENDTVSVEELMTTFGDNDRLAALVTNLLRASLLVILSDVDGLYDGDPGEAKSRLISTVTRIDDSINSFVRDKLTGQSKGGMASKINAARIATAAGENVIVASGRREGILADIMAGKVVGTLFLAEGKSISPRKRWIGFSAQICGRLELDAGACRAIVEQGRSLLPIGVVSLRGEFEKGEVVELTNRDGQAIGRGLSNYSSGEISRIKGLQSDRIAEILGHHPYDELVHRDNMVVLDRNASQ